MKIALLAIVLSFSALAEDLKLNDYSWWTVTDITSKNLTAKSLFKRMDREFIKTKSSICSNRALMWANDFKRDHDLNTAKIFLFYTKKEETPTTFNIKTWWYHVAPVVNENSNLLVLDAGFPGFVNGPLTTGEWLKKFVRSSNCKEINANETDLVSLIFNQRVFPKSTSYGNYDCYYKIVPHTIWTPEVLALNLLGTDRTGRPVRVERDSISLNELYQACLEATTGSIGYTLGASKEKCKEYVGL